MDVSERQRKFIADVTQRLGALDIEPHRVTIAYQDDLQDYSVLVGGEVSDDQIEQIIESVAPLLYVELEKDGSSQRYLLVQARRRPSGSQGGVIGGT